MASASSRDRMDNMVMATSEVHCLRLVAPPECMPEGHRQGHYGNKTPGVYIKQEGLGASPIAKPSNEMRLLSRGEALNLAEALDRVADPRPHMGRPHREPEEWRERYPESYRDLIDRWYTVLGERLDLAIQASEDRRVGLREVRAALTGAVSDAG